MWVGLHLCMGVCGVCIWWPPPPLFYGEACCTVWDGLCVLGGVGELAPALCRVWMGGYDSVCGGLLVYPWETYRAVILPASPCATSWSAWAF